MSTRISPEHGWAHYKDGQKTKTRGKSGALSFDGHTAISFSTVIGFKYPNKKGDGGTAVIAGEGIWNSGYTQMHKSRIRRALPPGWNTITVDVSPNTYYPGRELTTIKGLKTCHDMQKKNLAKIAEKVRTAKNYRSRAKIYSYDFVCTLERTNDLARFLKRKEATAATYGIDAEAEQANEKRREEARNRPPDMSPAAVKRREKAAEYRANEYNRNLAKWRDGLINQCPAQKCKDRWGRTTVGYGWDNPDRLRLKKVHDEWIVQTNRGVTMSVKVALFAYIAATRVKNGEPASDYAERHVGSFVLHEISATGDIVVGCHRIKYEEMDELYKRAQQLGALPEKETQDADVQS